MIAELPDISKEKIDQLRVNAFSSFVVKIFNIREAMRTETMQTNERLSALFQYINRTMQPFSGSKVVSAPVAATYSESSSVSSENSKTDSSSTPSTFVQQCYLPMLLKDYIEQKIFAPNGINVIQIESSLVYLQNMPDGKQHFLISTDDLNEVVDRIRKAKYPTHALFPITFFRINPPTPKEIQSIFYFHHIEANLFKSLYPKYQIPLSPSLFSFRIAIANYILHNADKKIMEIIAEKSDSAKQITSIRHLKSDLFQSLGIDLQVDHYNQIKQNGARLTLERCESLFSSYLNRCKNEKSSDDFPYQNIFSILYTLSNGQLSAIKQVLQLIATSYLGLDFTQNLDNDFDRKFSKITVVVCNNISFVKSFIEDIFSCAIMNATTSMQNTMKALTGDFVLYSNDTLADLSNQSKFNNYFLRKYAGKIVNITTLPNNSNIDTGFFMDITRNKKYTFKDKILGDIVYQNTMQYIFITDQIELSQKFFQKENYNLIHFEGDVSRKSYKQLKEYERVFVIYSAMGSFVDHSLNDSEDKDWSNIAPKMYSQEEAIKKFLSDFCTVEITNEKLQEIKKVCEGEDYSGSENDTKRRKKARDLGIEEYHCILAEDFKVAYEKWRSTSPEVIPNLTREKIISELIEQFDAMCYIKRENVKSVYDGKNHPSSKVFYGIDFHPTELENYILKLQNKKDAISMRDRNNQMEEFLTKLVEKYPPPDAHTIFKNA